MTVSRAILEADGTGSVSVDGSAQRRSEASSGFSGALYDGTGRDAGYDVGAPQTPPSSVPFGPPSTVARSGAAPTSAMGSAYPPPSAAAGSSPWWSDATADPWRDPQAPAAIVISAPEPPITVETPDFTPARKSVGLGQVILISVLAALLAGALGGALGYVAAVRGGLSTSSALGGGGSNAPGLAQRAPTSIAGIVRTVMPSVVTIRVDSDFGSAIGSGFIVSSSGYVITNDHVVDGLTGTATVTFNNSTTASAKLIGSDAESDVAVLKVNKAGLRAVTFGDSDSIAVGDPVLAVGAPLDLPNSVTSGIVSALRRPLEISSGGGPTRYYSAIQTDAAVNHGNSGGPLFDAAGRVIGVDAVIKSLGSSDQDTGNIGLAFAIPIDQARRVAEQIIDSGKVTRTVMGATVESSYRQNPNGGVPLASVAQGGPAAAAGIQRGDVVMEIGGSLLTASGDLTALVRAYAPGSVVPVVFTRNGVSHTAQVKLANDAG